jgi:hypothetical protein
LWSFSTTALIRIKPGICGRQARLERFQASHARGEKGFTNAGIRKLVARLHEELAAYEGSEEARGADLK